MNYFTRAFCLALFSLLIATSSHAQATRTWVSGVGDDANPCSRTAPCKTFAGAISKTLAGGEINCLDPGGFGALTITKAITVSCESVEGGVLVAGTNGINVAAGTNDFVVLRGLDFVGVGSGLDGIKFTSGAVLHVEKCTIRGFLGSPGNGIHFAPTGTSQMFVTNTLITGNSQSGAGIQIQPTGTGTASVLIDGVRMLSNGNGLIADGTQTTGSQINVMIRNSEASGNGSIGIKAISASGKAPVRVVMDHSAATTNNTGVSSTGQGADVIMAFSFAVGNVTGVTFTAPAQLRSYQNNGFHANNATNGTPSSTIPPD
jgi:Right handed beta helix region